MNRKPVLPGTRALADVAATLADAQASTQALTP